MDGICYAKEHYMIDVSGRGGGERMSTMINDLLKQYVREIRKIYGNHLKSVILYGSYARGDDLDHPIRRSVATFL